MGGLFTLEALANRAVVVSRREEAHPQHWLGGHGDPGDIPDRGWNARDEPTDEEERRAS
jgi:hypothetical protein